MEHMPCYIPVLPSQHQEIAFKCKVCCGSPGLGNTPPSLTSSFFFSQEPCLTAFGIQLYISPGFLRSRPVRASWSGVFRYKLHGKEPAYWTNTDLSKNEVNRNKMTNSGGFFPLFIQLPEIPFLFIYPLYSLSTAFLTPGEVCWAAGFPSPQKMEEVLSDTQTLQDSQLLQKSSGTHSLHLSWAIFTLAIYYDKYYGQSFPSSSKFFQVE